MAPLRINAGRLISAAKEGDAQLAFLFNAFLVDAWTRCKRRFVPCQQVLSQSGGEHSP